MAAPVDASLWQGSPSHSLQWSCSDVSEPATERDAFENVRRKGGPVGLFWDIADLWEQRREKKPGHLVSVAAELCKLSAHLSHHGPFMKHAVVLKNQIGSVEYSELERLTFQTDLCASPDQAFEVISNAMLLWLWDQARSHGSLGACVVLVSSNQKFGPLITKLKRRNVDVLLVAETSGWLNRRPVPPSMYKDATYMLDFNSIHILVERHGVPPPPADRVRHTFGDHSPPRAPMEPVYEDVEGTMAGPDLRPLTPGHNWMAHSTPLRLKTLSTDSADSEHELEFSAQTLDLRLGTSQNGWENGASNTAQLLRMRQPLGITRSETVDHALRQIENTVRELETAWTERSAARVTKLLRKFAQAGFEVQPYLTRLMAGKPIIITDEDADEDPASQERVRESVSADQFGFVLECVRHLYVRLHPENPRRAGARLDAAHLLISALEVCDVGAQMDEDLHHTAVDIVHRLLERAPALTQADRLLHIVGVPDHLDQVLLPYVKRWMRERDHALSAQAYNFAYRTGLMDTLRDTELSAIDNLWSMTSSDIEPLDPPPPLSTPPPSGIGVTSASPSPPMPSNSASPLTLRTIDTHFTARPASGFPALLPNPLPQTAGNSNSAANLAGFAHPLGAPPSHLAATTSPGPRVARKQARLDTKPALGRLGPDPLLEAPASPPPPPRQQLPTECHGPGPVVLHDEKPTPSSVAAVASSPPSHTRVSSTDSLSALLLRPLELVRRIPDSVEDRIMELLTKHKDGLLGSDIPRFYWDEYGERLELPENPATKEKFKLKDFLLSITGVSCFTKNTQPVFIALEGDEDLDQEQPEEVAPVDHRVTRERLLGLLRTLDGVLGAQLPSKFLELYEEPLRLEASDGTKTKLKEYLLSEEMTTLLTQQSPPLKLALVKAGHDRRYTLTDAD